MVSGGLPRLDIAQATRLGFAFAEQAQLTSFGPLSSPLISAGSVAEIVDLLTYLPLISTALKSQFHAGDYGLIVGLTAHTGDSALDCLVITYGGRRYYDCWSCSPVALHLSWPEPTEASHDKGPGSNRRFFDAPISFVHVPEDTLNKACRFSDPLAYRLAIADLQRTLAHRGGSMTSAEKVRQLLEKDLGQRTNHDVAQALSMSSSTLKRRLAEERTTYSKVRQSLLYERAMLRLLDRSVSVSEIATELGYSDLANFSHAFKRWTGRSPKDFRNPRLSDDPDST